MADFRDRYKNAKDVSHRGGAGGADYDELPQLSQALAGVWAESGQFWELPPHSLTVWLEDGRLKWVLGAKNDVVKTFGTSEGLSAGFQGIEKALVNGQCETKKVLGKR